MLKRTELRTWKKVFESDLSYIAYELKEQVNKPAMVVLEGDLGAGKTTFTKIFIEGGQTFSPTYSILSEAGNVLHADMYRIKTRDEIIYLELPLYLEDKEFFLVEWGEKHFASINRELPEDFHTYLLTISINNSNKTEQIPSRNFALYDLKEE